MDEQTVRSVAENARLKLDDEEASKFKKDFEEVLQVFSDLDDVDTENVEPLFQPGEPEPDTREDAAEQSIPRGEAFQNTENTEDGYFKGPSQ